MQKKISPDTLKGIYRIIDANINRTKEGLRVCEEICRFILNNPHLTALTKKIRHRLQSALKNLTFNKTQLFHGRDSETDAGKYITAKEGQRENHLDVFFANINRVKESLRVLEEFLKISDLKSSKKIKALRYDIYGLEKKIAQKLMAFPINLKKGY